MTLAFEMAHVTPYATTPSAITTTPFAITINPDLGRMAFVYNLNENNDGTITVVWANSVDVNVNELFTINFRIRDDIAINSGEVIISPVRVSITDMRTANLEALNPPTRNGHIEISYRERLWGDVDNNGVVDIHDVIALAQYLAGIPDARPCDIGYANADVDRNGHVNISDLILIAQYVACWHIPKCVVLGVPQ